VNYFIARGERFLNHLDLHAQITQQTMKKSCPPLTGETDTGIISHKRFYEYRTHENYRSYKMSVLNHKNMSISASAETGCKSI
jgi:hypothetical protein